jgi:hypothetical protein
LSFAKVLDTYEEIDDGQSLTEDRIYTREDWARKAKWTLETADTLVSVTSEVFGKPALNYLKPYVAITVDGSNYMWLHRRTQPKSFLVARMIQSLQDEAAAILDSKNITYVRKTKTVRLLVDMIDKNADVFKSLATLVKKSWEGGV